MPRGRTHTMEQIIQALRGVDEGVGDVCRQLGIVDVLSLARKVRRDGASRSSWRSSYFTMRR